MRLGEAKVVCNTSERAAADGHRSGRRLSHLDRRLTTAETEDKVREVFEFVEFDCDLSVEMLEDDSDDDGSDDPDIADILARIKATSDDEEGPREEAEQPAEPEASAAPAKAAAPAEPKAAPAKAAAPAASAAAKADGGGDAKGGAAGGGAAQTIRVDLERVDRLIDLVGELVINQAMLSQRVYRGRSCASPRTSPSASTSSSS